MRKVKDGFAGQRFITISASDTNIMSHHLLTKGLYVTSMGYFPKEKYHFFQRPAGFEDYILFYVQKVVVRWLSMTMSISWKQSGTSSSPKVPHTITEATRRNSGPSIGYISEGRAPNTCVKICINHVPSLMPLIHASLSV